MQTYTVNQNEHKEITISESGEYVVELVGQGAEVTIGGTFLAQNHERVDINLVIHHKAENTLAKTMLKGVARDTAHVRFFGKIIIDPECGNSNSFLTERILLLSDTASAEAVPELEILTDDVKCSHAASISQIPEEHIFYLMSRGIPRLEAEEMIVEGFLQ